MEKCNQRNFIVNRRIAYRLIVLLVKLLNSKNICSWWDLDNPPTSQEWSNERARYIPKLNNDIKDDK